MEGAESGLIDSTLQEKFAELDSEKPRPYGTLHAVGSSFPFYSFGFLVARCPIFLNLWLLLHRFH